jgi:EmrB/QacA subfamily drug resistance transporter
LWERWVEPMDGQQVYERRWVALAVICLSLSVISLDNTILNVALPSIVRQLGATGSQLQWIIDSYIIVFACLLLTAGALGDRFGRKGALTAGLVLFGSFSALAAMASSPSMLIAARGLMGIGAAFIFPTTLSILTNIFTGPERAKAIGIWAGVSGIGVAIGPLIGGLLVEHFWWGSVFLVNVPVCAIAIVLGRFFIPTSRDVEGRGLDLAGAGLSILTLLGLMYGIIQVPVKGWSNTGVLAGFAVGAVFLSAFAFWELRSRPPTLDVRFFKNPRFSAASATVTLVFFAMFGSTFLLTQYFQFVLGYSPLKAGMMTAPIALGLVATAPNAPRLVDRWGTTRVILIGLAIICVSLLMYGSNTIMSSVLTGSLARIFFGVGIGLTTAPATESIMGSLPRNRAGVGSAVNDTTRQTGGALGVAVIGSIFAASYHRLLGTVPGVPAAAVHAAKDSIGTALATAAKLPAPQAAALRHAAVHAYLNSMHVVYPIAVVFVVLAMVICARFLPARAATSDAEDHAVGESGQRVGSLEAVA